ncbi:Cytochrome c family protein precursor [hydrothermal vent metagenome]|uniref:Cytochrome c family protein n=1 Tax=hydrothermal vent metagenome TaxID=652676 RepID=A0A3B0YHW7_9ZZZZ
MLKKIIFCLLFFSLPVQSVVLKDQTSTDVSDKQCLECHGVKGFSSISEKNGVRTQRPIDVNYSAMQQSLHGKLECIKCHQDIKELPHKKEKLKTVNCVSCHEKLNPLSIRKKNRPTGRGANSRTRTPEVVSQTKNYNRSIHGDPSKDNNASCNTCHTAHYVFKSDDPRALNYRENSPQMCGDCHQKALKNYKKSVHGATLKTPWKGESATCTDCHSAHEITQAKGLSAHRIVTKNCGNCHEKEVASYMSTTHGQLAWLGNEKVAKCIDCHRGHNTRKPDDPKSMISSINILETCKECHKDAGDKIVEYRPHGNTSDFDKYPAMFIVGKFMVGIVILVLIFFYSHSVLWFVREYKERTIIWYTENSRSMPVHVKPEIAHSNVHFQRFSLFWRLNHWALALSVMTLTLTGMAVMYPDTDWAVSLVNLTGGSAVFGVIHRTAGVIFLVSVFGHGIIVLSRLLKKKDFDWFGPDSLLPRWKDWDDMKAMFRWFFGRGKQPQLDRWTYWEKFDYWAVYWGAFVIGLSGVVLWASPTLLKFLPGWSFNIATIAHGVEAFLAVATLFVVHFFNNHFRPEKFPLDTVMFTGSWDLEEFKHERPLEYARLKESGELEKHLVKPPSKRANIIFHIIGFTLLATGITLLAMVIIGFVKHGLV